MSASPTVDPVSTGRARIADATPSFARRVGVTLLVLAIYQVGLLIPAPGVDVSSLANSMLGDAQFAGIGKQSLSRLSIFALGTVPLISAFLFGEVIKLAFAGMNDWINASAANRTAFNRRLNMFALFIAALQAYGVAIALEAMPAGGTGPLLIAQGAAFKTPYIATLVAATALCIWFADIISRHGIGSGVWVLLLWPSVAALAAFPAQVFELSRNGQIAPAAVVAAAVVTLAAAVATAAVVRRWLTVAETSGPAQSTKHLRLVSDAAGVVVWPLYLGAMFAGWGYVALDTLPTWLFGRPLAMLQTNSHIVANFIMLTVTLLMTVLMARAFADAHLRRASPGRPLVTSTMALQVGALAAFEALIAYGGVPLPLDAAAWIAMVCVLTLAMPRTLTTMFDTPGEQNAITDDDFAAR